VQDGRLAALSVSGDFFFYPEQKLTELAEALIGVPVAEVEPAIARFYEEQGIESPGVTPADFAQALA
jgi:hypothetical protein